MPRAVRRPLLALSLLAIGACGGGDGHGSVAAVDEARYQADLLLVAKPRPPGSAHWQEVQDLCFDRLSQLGYATERAAYGSGTNVVGVLKGRREPERQVILSAHYDHIEGCDGADDNASGVAGLLEAARALASLKPDRTLVIAFWDEEERGLIGSKAYVAQAKQRSAVIEHAYVLDMIGYKSDEPNSQVLPDGANLLWREQVSAIEANQMRADFIVACFDESAGSKASADELVAQAKAISLPLYPMVLFAALKDVAELQSIYNGDHASFWRNGYSATMLNDTSVYRKTNYHCHDGPDTADRLSSSFATKIVQSVVGAAQKLLASGT
jgi:Zn-dependent M28 family amino/carboxypeptidase